MLAVLRRSFQQLYLLLWRNAVIRWRVGSVTVFKTFRLPLFQGVEVLWPLVLYIILESLRLKFPPGYREDTVYRAYAMPSAGALPFMQTLFCDLGDGQATEPYSDMPTFLNATLNSVYPVLDEVGSWNVSWTKLCDTLHSLAAQGNNCLDSTNKNLDTPLCSAAPPDRVPVTCYLKNETEFQEFLESKLQLSPGLVHQILNATVDTSKVPDSGGDVIYDNGDGGRARLPSLVTVLGLSSGSSLKLLVCNTGVLDDVIHFPNITMREVQHETCQLSDSQWNLLNQQLQEQIAAGCSPEELSASVSQVLSVQQLLEQSDLVQLLQTFSSLDVGGEGGGGSRECEGSEENCNRQDYVQFFCGSSRSELSPILKGLLNQNFIGDSYRQAEVQNSKASRAEIKTSHVEINSLKIPYTPATNLTLSIIRKANRTFETIAQVMALSDQVANCSQFFLDNFTPESLSSIREVLDEVIAYRKGEPVSNTGAQYLANLYPNASLEQLQQTQDMLNTSSPNNIWTIMKTVHTVAMNIHGALAQFDWDVFLPVTNETAMEHLFRDFQEKEQLNITYLVAGLVFDSDLPHTTGSTIKNTTIRIRTNFSSVVDPTKYRDV